MKSAVTYYINLNYVCNERCVFCASDLTNDKEMARAKGYSPWLRRDDIATWVQGAPPGPDDRVMLAGGEPTLSHDLFEISRFLRQDCPNVTLFTNGIKLADSDYAREAVEAGITHYQIAFFGASPESHDAITQLPGSFEKTMVALANLISLGEEGLPIRKILVRLLVSRQTIVENPDIVRVVRDRIPGITTISMNRLILSDHASNEDASISWEDSRGSINKSMCIARESGFEVDFDAIPFCLFEGENTRYVLEQLQEKRDLIARGLLPGSYEMRYLDPPVFAGIKTGKSSLTPPVMPPLCQGCDLLSHCPRVESWYLEKYGQAGLATVKIGALVRAGLFS